MGARPACPLRHADACPLHCAHCTHAHAAPPSAPTTAMALPPPHDPRRPARPPLRHAAAGILVEDAGATELARALLTNTALTYLGLNST